MEKKSCCCPEKCKKLATAIKDQTRDWEVTDLHLREIMRRLLDCILKGLCKKTHALSSVKCFPTYVQDLPDGTEQGKFLALDLGGTNFRVLLVTLEENSCDMRNTVYTVPQEVMLGSGPQLMDHIAYCLAAFMKDQGVEENVLPLGFTFSFPLYQKTLTAGILQKWTKGFNCSESVGEDMVAMLQESINRRGDIKILICAILNDTTGTLMSCAWKNRNCKIGLIIGTGTNACYVEKQTNAQLFEDRNMGSGNVLINTEWGAFGDNGELEFVRNEYDRIIDQTSINPGKQIFEKMISGMYVGEMVRLTLEKLTKQGLLFGGKGSQALFTRGSFSAKYLSDIESENIAKHTRCKEILEGLNIKHYTEDDLAGIRYVCEMISKRAAYLVSAGLSTILDKMSDPYVTVGVDGSLYRLHPHFHNLMTEKISQLVKPGLKFDLMLSEDGSGRGAALVAAMAVKRIMAS